MGGRGSKSSRSDKQLLNSYKERLESQGIKNVVTFIRDSNKYLDGTFYRQGFRDTSFRILREGNVLKLEQIEFGNSTPTTLAKGVKEINKIMAKKGLVFTIGG